LTNVLVIGPHPDDQELGMGGTIARLAAQGHTVTLVDMTTGEPTPFGTPETRVKESAAAAAALSAPNNPVRRVALGLKNRFVEHTIEARHKVAGVIRATQAQILFVPYFEDAHPDHLAVTRIAEDARFDAKLTGIAMPGDDGKPPLYPRWLFYYYATHLRIVPAPSFLIDTTGFEKAKRAAIDAYHSQFAANPKNAGVPDLLDAAGRYFGSRIGTASAEPFFTREPIGLTSIDSLPI
jgi:bacillithiol biosynthesis deacetylase BshB1